jgi:hypothetical protein
MLAFSSLLASLCGAAELGRTVPPVVQGPRAARGGTNPAVGFQIALFEPVQAFPRTHDVQGVRLNLLYGRNSSVRGLDFGVVNGVDRDFAGAQIGIHNSFGAAEEGCFQFGLMNTGGSFRGMQMGAINMAGNASGLQLGLLNMCDTMQGIQVGVLNFIFKGDNLLFCPLVNAQF